MEIKHYFVNYDDTFFGQMHIYPNNDAYISIFHPFNSVKFDFLKILKFEINGNDENNRISDAFKQFCKINSKFDFQKFKCVNADHSLYIDYSNAFIKALNNRDI